MQLNKDKRIFILLEYEARKTEVRRAFNEKFRKRNSPDMKTVYRTVRKFNELGNILNRQRQLRTKNN